MAASGVPIILCSFLETFIDVFFILLSSERKAGNLIYELKFGFFFDFYG